MAKPASPMKVVGSKYQDVLGDIRNSYNSFRASEISIADVIIENPESAASMNISQLAEVSDTSVASVVRFAKAMGYKGYPEFRMALISEIGRMQSKGVQPSGLDGGITLGDSAAEVIRKIATADSLAIQATAEKLDIPVFNRVVDTWSKSKTIGIFGVGSSGFVAMDLQLKLNRLGKNAIAWQDAHTALTSVSLLKRGDALVAISHSGTTVDVIDVMNEFKSRGVKVILITNSNRNPATALAHLVLLTSARETTFRSGATASRIAQLTVVDCLCVSLAQKNWAATKVALDDSRQAVGSRTGKKINTSDFNYLRPASKSQGR